MHHKPDRAANAAVKPAHGGLQQRSERQTEGQDP